MSWIRDNSLSWFQSLCVKVIRSGRVPKHVAFIMDGNRRYAQRHNVQKIEGHSRGFNKLAETLHWCSELGIKEVTVYAFSIENFKRTQEEVDALMDLARQKFQRLLDEKDKLMEKGVQVRVIGNLNLLPMDLRKMMAEAMLLTKDNNKAILNIAYAYTARVEIMQGVQEAVSGVVDNILSPSNLTQEVLSKTLYTNESPVADLLIRTSGEVRLSDFMLWQVSCSCVYFTDVLWPDFTVWHLLAAVFHFQRSLKTLEEVSKQELETDKTWVSTQHASTYESFVERVNQKRFDSLTRFWELEVSS